MDLATSSEAMFRAEALLQAFELEDGPRIANLIHDDPDPSTTTLALVLFAHRAITETATVLDTDLGIVRQAIRASALAYAAGASDG